jgi:catechol 2,3-dioxygenase-like lactoylglutathione lyase family enzyme
MAESLGPIRIKGLDHVVLRVADMDRAIRFYGEVLGCAVEWRRDDIGLVHLRAGSAQIDLVDIAGQIGSAGGTVPGKKRRNMDHFCVNMEDFDEAAIRAHLEAHGVAIDEVARRFGAEGDGPSMYIHDPEGNKVELKGPPDDD